QRLSEAPYRCMVAPGALLQDLTEAFPIYTSRLKRIGEQLQAWRSQMRLSPGVLAHGDFHPKNILFAPSQTTVIDFDAFGVHEPAFDVGYCIGQLLSMAYTHCGTLAPGATAADFFWRRYAREGIAPWQQVSLATACTLIQVLHYTFHASHGADAGMFLPWLDLIERWIACDDPDILKRLAHSAGETPASA
ncbi:MAG TPA: phosphotransferase, partial [Ktedonobacterales bacterium]|nr:phosphotransferase [Ktedonobacterales bacterium]